MKNSKDYKDNYDNYNEEIDDEEIDKIIDDYYDYENNDLEEGSTKSNLQNNISFNKNQKIAVAVLGFFAILVIIMWFVQFKRNLSSPFKYHNVDSSINKNNNISKEENLKNKDTDGDGLSDWDELNVYYTSPYLEDSDSDGFSDKDEINSGNDPNCPAGRDCYGKNSEIFNVEGDVPESNNQLNLSPNINSNTVNLQKQNLSDEDMKKILSGEVDASALRKMLMEAGMPKEALDKISDKELLKVYKDMLGNNN